VREGEREVFAEHWVWRGGLLGIFKTKVIPKKSRGEISRPQPKDRWSRKGILKLSKGKKRKASR